MPEPKSFQSDKFVHFKETPRKLICAEQASKSFTDQPLIDNRVALFTLRHTHDRSHLI